MASSIKPRRSSAVEPEWADEKFVTATFGLGHTPIYNLRKAGLIRSLSTKGEGQKYGKRLYHVGSIRDYMAAQEKRERKAYSEGGGN